MYIEPTTKVYLLKNIPLDETYVHTLWWDSIADQTNYFASMAKYRFDNFTYNRVNRGVVKVPTSADNIYDCNYLMFQNTSFGNKWFYAFITAIEYSANSVSDVYFTIDVMQTWHFDYTVKECFVEREHIANDTYGANLVPEGLDIGQYIYNGGFDCARTQVDTLDKYDKTGIYSTHILEDTSIVVVKSLGGGDKPGLYGGVYQGCTFKYFTDQPDGVTALTNYLEDLTENNQADSVVTIYMIPSICANKHSATNFGVPINTYEATTWNFSFCTNNTYNGTHRIRNNKLATYPFKFLYCTDLRGNEGHYKLEYFTPKTVNGGSFNGQSQYDFSGYNVLSGDYSHIIAPKNYKGDTSNNGNRNEQMVFKGTPLCSWNVDAFKAYIAQNGGVIGTIFDVAISGFTGGINNSAYQNEFYSRNADNSLSKTKETNTTSKSNTLGYNFGAVANSLKQVAVATTLPNQARGNTNGDSIWCKGGYDFNFCIMHLTPEYAERIDEFFDKYGYATKLVKRPNMSSRPQWNYVQTIGCDIVGSVPADDMKMICAIFDHGVTFWKNPSNVGNYSLPNK